MSTVSLKVNELEKYLSKLYKGKVKVNSFTELGKKKKLVKKRELKSFGYGAPYLIEFSLKNSESKKIVLETIRPSMFGHEHFSDRAAILLWQHSAFNKLPKHVHSVDVGAFTSDGGLKSLGDCIEAFILTEHVVGKPYYNDLERLKTEEKLLPIDRKRCIALSNYLVDVHKVKSEDKWLYIRRIRDLIGHGECIFGLTDSYPCNLDYISEQDFIQLEKKCVEWRWKLKHKTHRLCRVHGDFHPWNILFQKDSDFAVLDRSRGEWGEAADDLTAMTINYLFYSLQTFGELREPFKELFTLFWRVYIERTNDEEIFQVVQPFYAWRGLVIASPLWYPTLSLEVRQKIFNFIKNVLETEKFEIENVNSYFKP